MKHSTGPDGRKPVGTLCVDRTRKLACAQVGKQDSVKEDGK